MAVGGGTGGNFVSQSGGAEKDREREQTGQMLDGLRR
eukprot:COSAG03_NODE_18750_length_349_cov_0.884000_2_plen_36_part_01